MGRPFSKRMIVTMKVNPVGRPSAKQCFDMPYLARESPKHRCLWDEPVGQPQSDNKGWMRTSRNNNQHKLSARPKDKRDKMRRQAQKHTFSQIFTTLSSLHNFDSECLPEFDRTGLNQIKPIVEGEKRKYKENIQQEVTDGFQ